MEAGFYDTDGYANGVAVSSSYAYVADSWVGLRIIIDASDPSTPVEAGFYDTGGYAYGVAISGSYVYVADGGDGLYIFQNDLLTAFDLIPDPNPEQFKLFQNFPNPFNPTTTIRYFLTKSTRVMLKIYNTLGQEMRTLVDEKQTAGQYSVIWDGLDQFGMMASSGIYIYNIEAGEHTESRKMLLIR